MSPDRRGARPRPIRRASRARPARPRPPRRGASRSPRPTSTSDSRDRAPSSAPTSTRPSHGPVANDSGGRSDRPAAGSRAARRSSRWPVSVPASSTSPSSRNHAAALRMAPRRGRTGRRVPRRIGRLQQRRPGEHPGADERQGRDRHHTTNPSDRLHELPPPAGSTGGRRARQPSWRGPLIGRLSRSARHRQGVGCTPHRDAWRPHTFDAVRSRSRCDSGTVPLR